MIYLTIEAAARLLHQWHHVVHTQDEAARYGCDARIARCRSPINVRGS